MRLFVSTVLLAGAAIAACSTGDPGASPSPPPTLAQKCAASCAAPSSSDDPCHGATSDPGCASSCETTLAGKSDDCVSCWLSFSGFTGTSCDCDQALGPLGSVTCTECRYHEGSKSCGTNLIDKCTNGAQSCPGYKAIPLEDPACATKCGVTAADQLAKRCKEHCVRPEQGPCNAGPQADVDACVANCAKVLTGKSAECETCYFTYSKWLASYCRCNDTQGVCFACTLLGNPPETCTVLMGGTFPQCDVNAGGCVGFHDEGIDTPACAASCGVPPRDASTDAPADSPDDAPNDAGSDAADGD
jgi:hypothetical protein